ncbi:GGDEF domain-containing protein [Marinobacterium sp. AK62]|uniref:diguanylate cyclase n=1 Tax=Marinobacterium alkalitolerans TaxID=1542925 RepID=A0ABS3ZCG6_9GAMM|nr:GGDEF domain-containing protein [Marinobacterium alkalitolerans]MBP0049398.1 GGDEF domain-containing protein [Marinobacterium alkalitolerans]
MKTTALTRLLEHAPTPVALIKDNTLKWHNLGWRQLADKDQSALLNWASNAASPCTLLAGQVFARTTEDNTCLIMQAPPLDEPLRQQVTQPLLQALQEGQDPFHVLPEVLSRLLGRTHVTGSKLSGNHALNRVGRFETGHYRAPETLPLESDPIAARLYTGDRLSAYVEPDESGPIACRVDASHGHPLGHFTLMAPDKHAKSPLECLLVLQACAQLIAAWHDRPEARQEASSKLPTDRLTGLATRDALDQQLKYCERRFTGQSQDFLLAMIDIDNLSAINQSLGQRAGDEVLKSFAGQLRHICRPTDHLFRFGGDEFVILFHHDDLSPPLADRLEKVNRKMSRHLDRPFESRFGSAALSEARGSGDELLLLADQRLRKAKSGN